jgi:hypothetical protein
MFYVMVHVETGRNAMKLKTTFAAIALSLAPTLALAMGCGMDRTTTSASQCAVGQVWDQTSNSCITPVTG